MDKIYKGVCIRCARRGMAHIATIGMPPEGYMQQYRWLMKRFLHILRFGYVQCVPAHADNLEDAEWPKSWSVGQPKPPWCPYDHEAH